MNPSIGLIHTNSVRYRHVDRSSGETKCKEGISKINF